MSKYPYLPQTQNQYQPDDEDDQYIEEALNNYQEDYPEGQQMSQLPQQPQFQQQPQQSMQLQKPYNPYYDGIRSAISEARQSFAASNEQRNRALRQSILSFGNSIGGMERERGFKNNLLSAGRALAPAIQTYDNQTVSAENANQELADKMLGYKKIEDDRAERARAQMMQYQMMQQAQAEKLRHNKAIESAAQARLSQMQEEQGKLNPAGLLETEFVPIESKAERNMYLKDKKGTGAALESLNKVDELFQKFRASTADDTIDPLSPLGRPIKRAEGLLGRFANNKRLKDEEAKREEFRSKLGIFVKDAERQLKGGILGPKIVQMFRDEGLFPDYSDSPEIIQKKFDQMREHLESNYEAATLSLKSNYHLDPYELSKIKGQEEVQDQSPNELIKMIDQEGQLYEIPNLPELIEEAERDGFSRVD